MLPRSADITYSAQCYPPQPSITVSFYVDNRKSYQSYLLRPRVRQTPHQIHQHTRHMPRDIEKQRNKEHRPKRQKAITHPLSRMPRDNMGDFMPQNCGKAIFVLTNRQNARIHEDLAPATEKRIISTKKTLRRMDDKRKGKPTQAEQKHSHSHHPQ